MKKLFMVLAVLGFITISAQNVVAQRVTESGQRAYDTEQTGEEPVHQQLKTKFIEGGPEIMGVLLILLIFGLALSIERIIYLSLATGNSKKLLSKVEEVLASDGVEAAMDVCRNTRGPVASIFYQGLSRMDQGIEVVEKAVVSYGAVQMSQLEKGLSWIQLFISAAPMVGFLGTVLGMVIAFDDIARAGDISPNIIAVGMKVVLITTIAGLIVAIILQFLYNYIVSKIDSIVVDMEDASISMIDILVKSKK
ncbi:MAG: MotA/TolQ/ExbB proton channel family protein [Bacteroidales bacterium]|nr:MotA/TolQ/ExbB proton channel family protein [Bacteroidales bacterium]MCL2738891.1 MotA/TolQ/ExbB proton channel family protein [Bacteroidales bacterium]